MIVEIGHYALVHAYVTSDFSVVNVVNNSHSAKPLLYKISGAWGNHEGSMLLWVLMLAEAGSTRPEIRAAIAKAKAIEKPT